MLSFFKIQSRSMCSENIQNTCNIKVFTISLKTLSYCYQWPMEKQFRLNSFTESIWIYFVTQPSKGKKKKGRGSIKGKEVQALKCQDRVEVDKSGNFIKNSWFQIISNFQSKP